MTIASKSGTYLTVPGGTTTGDLGNLKEHYEEIVHLSEVPALEKGLTASNDAYFYSFIDKNGAVMWTVYDNGKGISEYIVAMTARLIRLNVATSGTQMLTKILMRDMLSIGTREMRAVLTCLQKISFMSMY